MAKPAATQGGVRDIPRHLPGRFDCWVMLASCFDEVLIQVLHEPEGQKAGLASEVPQSVIADSVPLVFGVLQAVDSRVEGVHAHCITVC